MLLEVRKNGKRPGTFESTRWRFLKYLLNGNFARRRMAEALPFKTLILNALRPQR